MSSAVNTMQGALVKKDLRAITSNKRMLSVLLIVPLVMVVFLPSVFILIVHFAPEEAEDFKQLLALLPADRQTDDIRLMVVDLLLNNIMPVFFLMIPIMAASVMAASSFVGEKEKRTLETLLYGPLTLRQIFQAKVLASFLMSMAVSLLSFAAMMVVVEVEVLLTAGTMAPPDVSWLAMLLLVSPAVSLIAVSLIVRGSAKAQTMEEAQQRSVFLVLPVILLVAGQFTGLLLINVWILLLLGVVLAAAAVLFLKGSFRKLSYETVLQ